MENYSLKELRDEMSKRVISLGINEKFANSPTFEVGISKLSSLIDRMNVFENLPYIIVKQDTNRIFTYIDEVSDKTYEYAIEVPDENTIVCTLMEMGRSYYSDSLNRDVWAKKAIEISIKYVTPQGLVIIHENGAIAHNNLEEINHCNNDTYSIIDVYTNFGVMYEKEFKVYSSNFLIEPIESLNFNSLLFIPREGCKAKNFFANKYDKRTLLRRVKLDIARLMYIEPKKGIKYCAETLINTENGLRDMELPFGDNAYPKEVVIKPLTRDEIDALLDNETNPTVIRGLEQFAAGRETYSYDSKTDKHFLYEFPEGGI